LIALVEIVSPPNKDRRLHVREFLDKAVGAVNAGVNLLVVDLFPPRRHDPLGLCNAIAERIGCFETVGGIPEDRPLSAASFVADNEPEMYVQQFGVGSTMPEMPLFLDPERYVNLPLEQTYLAAYDGMPSFYRDILEGRNPA